MANIDAAVGFKAYQLAGQPETNEYTIASEYDTDINSGDPVALTGTGRNVALAAAGTLTTCMVFRGCKWVDQQGNQHFSSRWPADTVGTDITCLVSDQPNRIYEIQADTLAEGDVGALADWNIGTPNTASGISGAYLDIAATTATTGKALRILGKVERVGNDYGAFCKARVQFVYGGPDGV